MLNSLAHFLFPHKKHHIIWDGMIVENGAVSLHQELDYNEPVGKGQFGIIYKGEYHLSSYYEPEKVVEVAVKEVKAMKTSEKEQAHEELDSLTELRAEHEILHLYNYKEEGQHVLFVTELCQGGDLFDYVKARERLSEVEARRVIRWLLLAVQKCHAHHICHADIKLENIGLVAKNNLGELRLLDFGKSKRIDKGPYAAIILRGTREYVAPELLEADEKWIDDPCPVDVWSIGVVAYALLIGLFPFATYAEMRCMELPFRRAVSDEARDLLARLLQKDPQKRLTLEAALNHPFVKTRE